MRHSRFVCWAFIASCAISTAMAQQNHPFLAPGAERTGFVSRGIENCMNKHDPRLAAVMLGAGGFKSYCECSVKRTADAVTYDDLEFMQKNNGPSDATQKLMDEISNACLAEVKSEAPGR